MYKRILLKLSGEALLPKNEQGTLDDKCIGEIVDQIVYLSKQGVEIAIVIGAGNIWRGKLADKLGIDHEQADYMGMMGTVINCVAIANSLRAKGVKSLVFNALYDLKGICLAYDKAAADQALKDKNVVLFAGGTGKPFFTTDTAATLRAIEMNCDAILMAKHGVDGVYDKDPLTNSDAKFLKQLTFQQVLDMNLKVMDASAVELIKDKDVLLKVFNMNEPTNIIKVVSGEDIGSTIRKD